MEKVETCEPQVEACIQDEMQPKLERLRLHTVLEAAFSCCESDARFGVVW